jgi:hypothetical protein
MLTYRTLRLALAAAFTVVVPLQSSLGSEEIFFAEDFSHDPATNGWAVYGDSSLFVWNPANQNLQVTWDSSKPNSYFCRPLGTQWNRSNDFLASFDLRLSDIATAVNPAKSNTFQISIGLIHLASATNGAFVRGDGAGTWNIVEFDYFDDYATVASTLVSSNSEFAVGGFSFPVKLTLNDLFRIELRFVAKDQTFNAKILRNGQPYGFLKPAVAGEWFSDFVVDHLAISSYSDEGQPDPEWAGSVLAHGTVDNFSVVSPPPVATISIAAGPAKGEVTTTTSTNWDYVLERTVDFGTWSPATAVFPGTGSTITLTDTNPPAGPVFYRVRSQRP